MLRLINLTLPLRRKFVVDDDVDEKLQENSSKDSRKDAHPENQEEQHEETNAEQNKGTSQTFPNEWRYVSTHPKDLILGDPSRGVATRSSLKNTCEHDVFISQIEPKSFTDVENDESWIMTMQAEFEILSKEPKRGVNWVSKNYIMLEQKLMQILKMCY